MHPDVYLLGQMPGEKNDVGDQAEGKQELRDVKGPPNQYEVLMSR